MLDLNIEISKIFFVSFWLVQNQKLNNKLDSGQARMTAWRIFNFSFIALKVYKQGKSVLKFIQSYDEKDKRDN